MTLQETIIAQLGVKPSIDPKEEIRKSIDFLKKQSSVPGNSNSLLKKSKPFSAQLKGRADSLRFLLCFFLPLCYSKED